MKSSYDRMLLRLVIERRFRFFAKRLREPVFVDRSLVCDGDLRVVLLRSRFISRDCCPTSKTYERGAVRIRISWTEVCIMHEQEVYASRQFGA